MWNNVNVGDAAIKLTHLQMLPWLQHRYIKQAAFAVGTNCFSFFYIYVQANQTLFIYKSFNAGNWTSDFKWLFWCILFSAKMNQTRNKDHGFVDYILNSQSNVYINDVIKWNRNSSKPNHTSTEHEEHLTRGHLKCKRKIIY